MVSFFSTLISDLISRFGLISLMFFQKYFGFSHCNNLKLEMMEGDLLNSLVLIHSFAAQGIVEETIMLSLHRLFDIFVVSFHYCFSAW